MKAALLLALAASASAADPAACSKGFTPELAAEWETTRGTWNSLCAKGYDAGDVLREVQRASVARCTAKFLPYEKTGKVPSGQAQAFCARGSSGRLELASSAGLPPDTPPPPKKPRIPVRKPGSAGMGPLSLALNKVREAWQADACLSAVRYYYRVLATEIGCTKEEQHTSSEGFDKYSFFFASPGSLRDIYRVTYTDAQKGCPDAIYLKGPHHENFPKTAGLSECLTGVKVDVGQAFAVAEANGWRASAPVTGWLANFPTGFFAGACGSSTGALGGEPWEGNYLVRCGDDDWDKAKLRRATGSPVWVLSSATQTAFVDALTGRFRHLASGEFCFKIPAAHLAATLSDEDLRCSD